MIKGNGNDNASWWVAILSGFALACAACTPGDKQVGSACKNGVCPAALATEMPVCLASELIADIEVTNDPGQPDLYLAQVCLPQRFATDDTGRVQCSVFWWLRPAGIDGALTHCSDLPFLERSPGQTDEGGERCLVPQLGANAADASTEAGWFYDDASDAACHYSGASAIRFTDEARPPTGVKVHLSCANVQEIGADGKVALSDGAMCRLPADSARHQKAVGDSCMPKVVPEEGFSESQTYIQTGAAECGTGACQVFHLQGDPTPGCKEVDAPDPSHCYERTMGDRALPDCDPVKRCADPQEVDKRVYCTCRCDGPGVDPSELCDCPDGFACVETVEGGLEALRGGYCVRTGT